ncbi:MAG: PilZ domain-containing protein [Rhizobiales bacterium]|nr:PilZ domain-containing protein [Hyphomicrobiales bacterium]
MDLERGNARRNVRRRTLKNGKIVLPGSWGTYDCIIKDVSDSGARLRLAGSGAILPTEFDLVFVTEALTYPVSLRWRRDQDCGVEFSGPPRKATGRGR